MIFHLRRFCAVFPAVLALFATLPASAADVILPGLVRTPFRLPVQIDGQAASLEAVVIRPDSPGRFPLVVLVHGTPRGEGQAFTEAIARTSPAEMNAAAVAFAQHSFAAVSIMRRGFGESSGPYGEDAPGRCEGRRYTAAVQRSGEDVAAAVAALREQPWAAPDRVLLVGQSTGGFAVSAAAALHPPGVLGVIDFAGGRGSTGPDQVCNPEGLIETVAVLGRTTLVPAQWIYAENDHFFGPGLAHRMFTAYRDAGAQAELRMQPPFGTDGHMLVARGSPDLWWPEIEPFLARLHLPTALLIKLPPLPSLPQPPYQRSPTADCREGYARYLAARIEAKAFAYSPSGHCGWQTTARTANAAASDAIRNCTLHDDSCVLWAIGQHLAN